MNKVNRIRVVGPPGAGKRQMVEDWLSRCRLPDRSWRFVVHTGATIDGCPKGTRTILVIKPRDACIKALKERKEASREEINKVDWCLGNLHYMYPGATVVRSGQDDFDSAVSFIMGTPDIGEEAPRVPVQKKKRVKRNRESRSNPYKQKARNELRNAVRRGQLSKPSTCSRCGSGGRISGHHHDYSRPLEVIWVCRSCHEVLDRERERGKRA